MEVNADFFGHRADTNLDTSSLAFQDIFPNQFFLVLTNVVGNGNPLIMDRFTGNQVWNHPIAGYQISPVRPEDSLGADSSAPGIYRVLVSTQVWWLKNNVDPGTLTEPFTFSDGPSYESRILRYEIWLDAPIQFGADGNVSGSGKVVLVRRGESVLGGAWRNSDLDMLDSHPDYLWIPHSVTASTGYSNPQLNSQWIISNFRSR
jgi:hypothetical protein